MGWLWAASSPKPGQDQPATSSNPPASSTPSHSQSAPSESVDPEIQKFLDLFKAEESDSSKPSSTSAPKSSSSTSKATSSSSLPSWLSSRASASAEELPAPPLDPVSESLLPTDMSCRQAFDLAWGCNSIGGQWNAVYRYGEMRSCSDQWDNFWFCMRTKSYVGEMKEKAIKAHYRKKEHDKYRTGQPSSEDIWEARSEKVPLGTAFTEPIQLPAVDDEEWRRAEDERRRKIRDGLGFDNSQGTT